MREERVEELLVQLARPGIEEREEALGYINTLIQHYPQAFVAIAGRLADAAERNPGDAHRIAFILSFIAEPALKEVVKATGEGRMRAEVGSELVLGILKRLKIETGVLRLPPSGSTGRVVAVSPRF